MIVKGDVVMRHGCYLQNENKNVKKKFSKYTHMQLNLSTSHSKAGTGFSHTSCKSLKNIPKMRLHAELLMTDLHGGCVGIYSAFFLPFFLVSRIGIGLT